MIYAPVAEIFASIQGEGYYTGAPVVFVRLAGCKQHCSFCDTKDWWETDKAVWMNVESVVHTIFAKIEEKHIKHVVITGGEPFEYSMFVYDLVKSLYEDYNILSSIETSGYVSSDHEFVRRILEFDVHVTLSPKYLTPDSLYFDSANELKLLVGISKQDDLGFTLPDVQKILEQDPNDRRCEVYFQPIDYYKDIYKKTTERCIEMCYQYGGKLSLQTHKMGGFK